MLLNLYVDPPAITGIEVTEVCTNNFAVSWTASSNEARLSYFVLLNDTIVVSLMDTSHTFTDLMPNTAYDVSVASILSSTCVGIYNTTMVTTLTVEAGVPQSELLIVVHMNL